MVRHAAVPAAMFIHMQNGMLVGGHGLYRAHVVGWRSPSSTDHAAVSPVRSPSLAVTIFEHMTVNRPHIGTDDPAVRAASLASRSGASTDAAPGCRSRRGRGVRDASDATWRRHAAGVTGAMIAGRERPDGRGQCGCRKASLRIAAGLSSRSRNGTERAGRRCAHPSSRWRPQNW